MEFNSFPIQEYECFGTLFISPLNSMTSISEADLSLKDFSSDDDHSSLVLAHLQTYNLPSDESFFNALVDQTSNEETFGHDNDISLHTHLEQLSYCDKNQELCGSSCIDKVEIDVLLGGADFSLQLLSLQDFLRVLVLQ
nr:hypothetical protein CFP56_17424 [Quercus suber]